MEKEAIVREAFQILVGDKKRKIHRGTVRCSYGKDMEDSELVDDLMKGFHGWLEGEVDRVSLGFGANIYPLVKTFWYGLCKGGEPPPWKNAEEVQKNLDKVVVERALDAAEKARRENEKIRRSLEKPKASRLEGGRCTGQGARTREVDGDTYTELVLENLHWDDLMSYLVQHGEGKNMVQKIQVDNTSYPQICHANGELKKDDILVRFISTRSMEEGLPVECVRFSFEVDQSAQVTWNNWWTALNNSRKGGCHSYGNLTIWRRGVWVCEDLQLQIRRLRRRLQVLSRQVL